MNGEHLFYICMIAVGSTCIALLAMCYLCFHYAKLARDSNGSAYRASDRERRDMHDFVSRLIEKQTIKPEFAANMHAVERRQQRERDAELESRAMRNEVPPPQPRRGEEEDPRDSVME